MANIIDLNCNSFKRKSLYTYKGATLYKTGFLYEILFSQDGGYNVSDNNFVIPEAYRPSVTKLALAIDYSGGYACYVIINTTGVLQFATLRGSTPTLMSSGTILGSIFYIV